MKQKFIYYFFLILLLLNSCSEPLEQRREKIDPSFWTYEGSNTIISSSVQNLKSNPKATKFEKYITSIGKPLWDKAHVSYGSDNHPFLSIPIVDTKKQYVSAIVFLDYDATNHFTYRTVQRKGLFKNDKLSEADKVTMKTYVAAGIKKFTIKGNQEDSLKLYMQQTRGLTGGLRYVGRNVLKMVKTITKRLHLAVMVIVQMAVGTMYGY